MMNGEQPQQPPTYDGNAPIEITLPLIYWKQLLNILTEATVPWKIVNPIITEVDKQCQAKVAMLQPVQQPQETRQ